MEEMTRNDYKSKIIEWLDIADFRRLKLIYVYSKALLGIDEQKSEE